MQAITPSITLGGAGEYSPEKAGFSSSFGGIYDDRDNQISALWNNSVLVCSYQPIGH